MDDCTVAAESNQLDSYLMPTVDMKCNYYYYYQHNDEKTTSVPYETVATVLTQT